MSTINYLEPEPNRPLDELFKKHHEEHDYPSELLTKLKFFMSNDYLTENMQIPLEFKQYFELIEKTRHKSFKVLLIFSCVLFIPEFKNYMYQNESSTIQQLFHPILAQTLIHYICGCKIDGSEFIITTHQTNKSNYKKVKDRHENSCGFIVEHLRQLYCSL